MKLISKTSIYLCYNLIFYLTKEVVLIEVQLLVPKTIKTKTIAVVIILENLYATHTHPQTSRLVIFIFLLYDNQ